MSYMRNIEKARKLLKAMEDNAERDSLGNIVSPVLGWCERLRGDIMRAERWVKDSKPDETPAP